MRTRFEVERDVDSTTPGYTGAGERTKIQTEVLLDIRDLITKLVEKGQKTKIVTTEVPFTEHEKRVIAEFREIIEEDKTV